ncbi:179_t:CDS:2, partial [Funneliformis geosporum]
MNVSTKFYGFIGLVSTIGKNGFHISQRVSEFNKTVCHYAEQTFAKLKKTAAYSAKFNEKAKNKCHDKLEQVQSLVVKKLSRPPTKIQTPEKA